MCPDAPASSNSAPKAAPTSGRHHQAQHAPSAAAPPHGPWREPPDRDHRQADRRPGRGNQPPDPQATSLVIAGDLRRAHAEAEAAQGACRKLKEMLGAAIPAAHTPGR